MGAPSIATQLAETADAFDSVAATYDGPQGNNALIQRMRELTWRRFEQTFPSNGTVLDIGCGTGIDALHLARTGRRVIATDWSGDMVERTAARAPLVTGEGSISARHLGVQELLRLADDGVVLDGVYSNFGPLNCDPDPAATATTLARLVRPGGRMVFTVIGRYCPWEIAHYTVQRRFSRVAVRFARDVTPVGMNGHTIWTRYYRPKEFAAPYLTSFRLVGYESLSLFVPPPYLTKVYERAPRVHRLLERADALTSGWPGFRELGDHFLIVLERV